MTTHSHCAWTNEGGHVKPIRLSLHNRVAELPTPWSLAALEKALLALFQESLTRLRAFSYALPSRPANAGLCIYVNTRLLGQQTTASYRKPERRAYEP